MDVDVDGVFTFLEHRPKLDAVQNTVQTSKTPSKRPKHRPLPKIRPKHRPNEIRRSHITYFKDSFDCSLSFVLHFSSRTKSTIKSSKKIHDDDDGGGGGILKQCTPHQQSTQQFELINNMPSRIIGAGAAKTLPTPNKSSSSSSADYDDVIPSGGGHGGGLRGEGRMHFALVLLTYTRSCEVRMVWMDSVLGRGRCSCGRCFWTVDGVFGRWTVFLDGFRFGRRPKRRPQKVKTPSTSIVTHEYLKNRKAFRAEKNYASRIAR